MGLQTLLPGQGCFLSHGFPRGPSGILEMGGGAQPGQGRVRLTLRAAPPPPAPPGAPTQRWSMQLPAEVSAAAGEAAVLPCTFTHPHRHYDGPLTAIWRAGEPFAGPQVFRCAAARGSELCQTALSLHGRFRLLGNPRRNDLSLRVERLALADEGRYFCRVEFAGDIHDRYESRHGVRLHVTGERGAGCGGGGSLPPPAPPAPSRPSRGLTGCCAAGIGRGAIHPPFSRAGPHTWQWLWAPWDFVKRANRGPEGLGGPGSGHCREALGELRPQELQVQGSEELVNGGYP